MEHYLSRSMFDGRALDLETRKSVWRDIIPPVIRALDSVGIVPVATHDFREVIRFQADHADKMGLFELSNPTYHPDMGPDNCYAIFLREIGSGNIVGCAGLRLVWVEDTLERMLTSLRFFYENPSVMAPKDHGCTVTAPTAYKIESCHVAVSVSLHIEQGAARNAAVKGVKLAFPLMRLLHIWALAHWRWNALIAFSDKEIAARYAYDPHGFSAAERGIWLSWHEREGYLLWAPRRYVRSWATALQTGDLNLPLGIPAEFVPDRVAAA